MIEFSNYMLLMMLIIWTLVDDNKDRNNCH